jgi:hypothetical protein
MMVTLALILDESERADSAAVIRAGRGIFRKRLEPGASQHGYGRKPRKPRIGAASLAGDVGDALSRPEDPGVDAPGAQAELRRVP